MTMRVDTNVELMGAISPGQVLQSTLVALSLGKVSELVDQFDDHFIFTDHALDLEFTERRHLAEFFQRSRELFPDTALEINSLYSCGDHAIAMWKLTATHAESYGSRLYRFPIALHGSTIVCVKNGKVSQWSDYYDQLTSRRGGLMTLFKEWIEY